MSSLMEFNKFCLSYHLCGRPPQMVWGFVCLETKTHLREVYGLRCPWTLLNIAYCSGSRLNLHSYCAWICHNYICNYIFFFTFAVFQHSYEITSERQCKRYSIPYCHSCLTWYHSFQNATCTAFFNLRLSGSWKVEKGGIYQTLGGTY